jgi:glycosyltransferase involved in cell wall biosynthesis
MGRRILVISEHASPLAEAGGVDSGGQNVYVAHVARRLSLAGNSVDVLTRRDSPAQEDIVGWKDGVRVVHVKAGPAQWVRKEDLLPHMGEFTDLTLRLIKSEGGYDVVHANFWMSGLVAAEIKKRAGIPFIVTFHALGRVRRLYQKEADGFPDERFAIEDRIVAEADRIIAECPQDRADLISLYKAPAGKIAVVPCGFDPAEFEPVDAQLARRKLGLPAGRFIVLHVGRIVPRKGIDTVINGFAQFLSDCRAKANLLVVGGEPAGPNAADRPEIERLKAIAADLAVDNEVSFLGQRGTAPLLQRLRRIRHDSAVRALRHYARRGHGMRRACDRRGCRGDKAYGYQREDRISGAAGRPRHDRGLPFPALQQPGAQGKPGPGGHKTG